MGENKFFIIGVVAVVLVAGLLIYATGNYGSQYTGKMVYEPEENVKVVHVTVSEYGFDPYEIVVDKDDEVTVFLKSEEFPFSFNLLEFGVHSGPVKEGEVVELTFVADEAGEFRYYDNERAFLERHEDRERQLEGLFIVREENKGIY